MSQVLVFTLLGDSNIRRHMNKNTFRSNLQVKAAQILPCGNLGILPETLEKIRAESNCCILSCMSNFISDCTGPDSVSQRVEPALQDVRALLDQCCESRPDLKILVAPPMYRTSPVWYREGLPEILGVFSQVFTQDLPPNLHLLPSFPTPEYDADGVHLTPYSGLEFILHLFDSSTSLISSLSTSTDEKTVRGQESSRALEDRVMVLEQDHRRLNTVVEKMSAAEAELADFHTNERFEDSFVISGLPAIPSEKFGKAWQDQAVQDVQAIMTVLLGKEAPIVVVQNATKRHQGAEVTYNVKLSDVAVSRSLRRKFGSFYLGSQDKRPDGLRHVNIKNRVTPETRTRIDVLKLLAHRYRTSNPGSKVQVIHYDPRPLIKITPAPSASDRRTLVYNYIDAVRKLPSNFTSAEAEPVLRRINPVMAGSIRSTFVVLSDDMFRSVISKFPKKSKGQASAASIAGADTDTDTDADVVPAPDHHPPALSGANLVPPSRSRSLKRGASSALGNSAKK